MNIDEYHETKISDASLLSNLRTAPDYACCRTGLFPAEQARDITFSDSTFYRLGKEAALEDIHPTGSFLTGLAFGLTMPFASGGAAALIHKSTGEKGDVCGIFTGLGTAVIWATCGSRLNWKRGITVPERHIEGMSPVERQDFETAYTETILEKRKTGYTFGFICGVLVPVAGVLYILSQIDGPIGGV